MWINFLKILNFIFNSNFTVAFVGGGAIFLYYKQKRDAKKDAAKVILQEIRNAENKIDNFKKNVIQIGSTIDLLLPINSWLQYRHLFSNNFDQDALNIINNFYDRCLAIDIAFAKINSSKQLEQKAGYIQETLAEIAKDMSSKCDRDLISEESVKQYREEYNQKCNNFLLLFEKLGYTFNPKEPIENILRWLNSVDKILVGKIGEEFKKIAKIK